MQAQSALSSLVSLIHHSPALASLFGKFRVSSANQGGAPCYPPLGPPFRSSQGSTSVLGRSGEFSQQPLSAVVQHVFDPAFVDVGLDIFLNTKTMRAFDRT